MKRDWATWAGRRVRSLPGVGAIVCAVAGVWVVTGSVGWGLLTAVPFLLAVDRTMP